MRRERKGVETTGERGVGAVSNPDPDHGYGLRGGQQEDVLEVLVLRDDGLGIGHGVVPDSLIG